MPLLIDIKECFLLCLLVCKQAKYILLGIVKADIKTVIRNKYGIITKKLAMLSLNIYNNEIAKKLKNKY